MALETRLCRKLELHSLSLWWCSARSFPTDPCPWTHISQLSHGFLIPLRHQNSGWLLTLVHFWKTQKLAKEHLTLSFACYHLWLLYKLFTLFTYCLYFTTRHVCKLVGTKFAKVSVGHSHKSDIFASVRWMWNKPSVLSISVAQVYTSTKEKQRCF